MSSTIVFMFLYLSGLCCKVAPWWKEQAGIPACCFVKYYCIRWRKITVRKNILTVTFACCNLNIPFMRCLIVTPPFKGLSALGRRILSGVASYNPCLIPWILLSYLLFIYNQLSRNRSFHPGTLQAATLCTRYGRSSAPLSAGGHVVALCHNHP